MQNEEFRLIKM